MPEPDDPGADLAPSARRPRLRIGVGAAVVLFLGSLGGAALLSAWSGGGGTVELPVDASPLATETVVREEQVLLVHVAGAVREPGLVQLAPGARVVDAITAAGGLAEDAAADAVNLARPVADGEQLVVPVVGEEPASAAQPGVSGDGRVRLSTADAATLETLPGIGPALAQRIIDWRTANGGFTDVEQLREVAGIGEVTLGRLRDLVVP
ncbi:helix-hairpin-helix domain-containing protein [Agromyces sp. SYSU T00194]|uniref:helix-hairpin-helix domain-containing protein n=1 Tax=Agromyces chitinivorans TaxID=3158560 RepID=UPI00339138BE